MFINNKCHMSCFVNKLISFEVFDDFFNIHESSHLIQCDNCLTLKDV
jgi:hypothetical protein